MDHPSSSELQPAGLAQTAVESSADATGDVYFKAGFGELEVMGSESDAAIAAKIVLDKIITDADQVGDIDILINEQAFELMKHGSMRDVDLPAISLANVDHFYWRLLHRLHLPELTIAGVWGKNDIF